MLLYVTLGSNDIARSRTFYDAALPPLGLKCNHSDRSELGYGPINQGAAPRDNVVWIGPPFSKLPATWGNGTMIAFKASSRNAVDAFHTAALANGGTDEGAPGLRPYGENFYAAYVRDPDGNKLSAVCELPE